MKHYCKYGIMSDMHSFDGIREFIYVAEAQSFTGAAKRIGISVSKISRTVLELERRLGVALFARSTRVVRLTESGLKYYEQCKPLLYALEEANEGLHQEQVNLKGILRVSLAGEFSELYIAPALIEFADQFPDLRVEMNFSSRMVNFVEEGYDFAIRYGRMSDSSLIARRLVNRSMVALAHRRYLDKYGHPDHPLQLSEHDCLLTNNDTWFFLEGEKMINVRLKGRLQSNSGRAVSKACQAGLGIAYMPASGFAELRDDPDMIPILQPFWNTDVTTWIVYGDNRFIPMKTRLAIDYLTSKFSNWSELSLFKADKKMHSR